MASTIAVIAHDPADRRDLADHLRAMGFTPRACASLVGAGTDPVVVCVRGREDLHLLAGLAGYRERAHHRVVVITRAPVLVRQFAVAARADMLEVLVPPLLLGQLGDALRESPGSAP